MITTLKNHSNSTHRSNNMNFLATLIFALVLVNVMHAANLIVDYDMEDIEESADIIVDIDMEELEESEMNGAIMDRFGIFNIGHGIHILLNCVQDHCLPVLWQWQMCHGLCGPVMHLHLPSQVRPLQNCHLHLLCHRCLHLLCYGIRRVYWS